MILCLVFFGMVCYSQSIKNKDSAYKYYILSHTATYDSKRENLQLILNRYWNYEDACLKQLHTFNDTAQYLKDMSDSLNRYRIKKIISTQ